MTSVVFVCLAFAFGQDTFDYFEEETEEVKGIHDFGKLKEEHMVAVLPLALFARISCLSAFALLRKFETYR